MQALSSAFNLPNGKRRRILNYNISGYTGFPHIEEQLRPRGVLMHVGKDFAMNQGISLLESKKGFDSGVNFLNSKNQKVEMDVVAFGKGTRVLVLIPGLSDGLATVKGKMGALKYTYRIFSNDFRVLVISRPQKLMDGYAIQDMASDYYELLKFIGCTQVSVWGVSMGGMIAQWMAINNPEFIKSMCLDVTTARASRELKNVLDTWMELAKNGKHKELTRDTLEKTYTQKTMNRYRLVLPLIDWMTRVKSYDRFILQAQACKNHDALPGLKQLNIPCLVTGGDNDAILGPGAVEELSQAIKNCLVNIYRGYGHGSFDENKGHNPLLLKYFTQGHIK